MPSFQELADSLGASQEQLLVGLLLLLLTALAPLLLSKGSKVVEQGKREDTKSFSREEVAKHSQEDDLWIILKTKEHGKHRVYDVTPYVEEHPGGLSIMNNAGKDSTDGFYGNQHPPRVFDLIDDFYIGDLADP